MKITDKIVTRIPLNQLWNSKAILKAKREFFLIKEEIIELLRAEKIKFVLANVGDNLEWIPDQDIYETWKIKLINNIANPSDEHCLEDFPNDYFYFASKWKNEDQDKDIIILFEKYH